MNKIHEWANTGLIVLVAILVLVGGNQSADQVEQVGAPGSRFPNGLSADTTSPIVGEVRGTYLTITSTATTGGGIRATSTTNTAETLLASDFDTENVIDYTPNGAVAGTTVTLPASSTLSAFIPTAGQTRTVFIRNATTTAATTVIIAGGSGTLLKVASSTNQIGGGTGAQQIYGDTDGGNHAKLEFLRKANTDIEVLMTVYRDN